MSGEGTLNGTRRGHRLRQMLNGLQDLTAQREILTGPGVPEDRIYPARDSLAAAAPGPGGVEDICLS
jgi:hypothetical protein